MLVETWLVIACAATADPVASVNKAFDTKDDLADCVVAATGEAAKRMPEPKISDGKLYLLESWWKSSATLSCPAPTETLAGAIDVSWTLTMNTGTEGLGFAWLDIDEHGREGPAPEFDPWEAPSITGSFGVGFDASNPPNRDPFRGSGNVYDRPQHEVSLHWNGLEIVKRMTEGDFRDEEPHLVRVLVEFVTGGSDVSVWIDEESVYDRYFVPSMTAFVGRPVFGARNTENAGDVLLDDLKIEARDAVDAPAPPLTITALERVLNDKKHAGNDATVEFPSETDSFERIICTLRLDKPETRFDPWDRLAHIFIFDDNDERFELLRYITPYHRGGVWQADVTDFRPLLRGTRKIRQRCSTQGEGWVVSVSFDFYPGKADRLAYKVVNLWSGGPEIGNPDKPVTDFYVVRTIPVDEDTAYATVRTVVTGHGMSPNSKNAAEFMPLGRTLRVNRKAHTNLLWKSDNYLNPCRPQGGTWKYDRAGWAPGDVVRPWAVDVTDQLDSTRELRIEYILDDYVNENRGKTWAPSHRTEAQVVLYRRTQ